MRRRNTELHARVNGNLPLEFSDVNLTSYAGLELFSRYLRALRFNDLIRTAFRGARVGGDFGAVAMVRVLIGLLVVGGRRLDHIRYLADDPVVQRFCRLRVVPTARTVSRWLTQFTMTTVTRLQAVLPFVRVVRHFEELLRLGEPLCLAKVLREGQLGAAGLIVVLAHAFSKLRQHTGQY